MTRTFLLGAARSGKSAHAEKIAEGSGKEVVYLATAQAHDREMEVRIAHHRRQRNPSWQTVETPIYLGDAISQWNGPDRVLIVDCLTVWISNLLFVEQRDYPEVGVIDPPACFAEQREAFVRSLGQVQGDIVIVSNEVGMGIIPQGAVSRWFVDEAGRMNQAVAAKCERVLWVAAGLAMSMKG